MDGEKLQFHVLDALRGLLALMVLLRHWGDFFSPLAFQETYLAVDLFFLISGVVLCQSHEARLRGGMGVSGFLRLRLARIYPLYLLGTLVGFAAFVLGDAQPSAPEASGLLVLALLMLPNPGLIATDVFPLNGPAWSLFFELAVNAVYGAIAPWLDRPVLSGLVVLSALCLVAAALGAGNLDVGFTAATFTLGVPRVCFSFFAGVAVFRVFRRRSRRVIVGAPARVLSLLAVIALLGLMTAAPTGTARAVFDLAAVLVIFPVFVFLCLFLQPTGWLVPVCRTLGLASYAVYALHAPAAQLLRVSLGGGAAVAATAPWLGLLFLAAFVPLCLFLDRRYDRPVRGLLLAGGRRPARAAQG